MKNSHLVLLERHDIPAPEDLRLPSDEEIDRIADQGEDRIVAAVESLGYMPQTVKQQRAQKLAEVTQLRKLKASVNRPLATALRVCGIKPFTPESVAAYQKAMCRQRFQIFEKPIPNEFYGVLFIVGFAVNTFGFICLGYLLMNQLGISHSLTGLGLIPFMAFLCAGMCPRRSEPDMFQKLCLSLAFGSGIILILFCGPADVEWKAVPLKGYGKDIPRPVLETVAEVHAHCPSAKFYIDELTKKPDPFLKAVLGNEEYYLEVWNEPKFDGSRAA